MAVVVVASVGVAAYQRRRQRFSVERLARELDASDASSMASASVGNDDLGLQWDTADTLPLGLDTESVVEEDLGCLHAESMA